MSLDKVSNWGLLKGLFPKWEPTHEEASLFRKILQTRNDNVMETAIENFRISYRYREPNLGGILKEYSSIMNEMRAQSSTSVVNDDGDDEEEHRAAVEASDAKILHELEMLTDEQIQRLSATIDQNVFAKAMLGGRLTAPPSTWSRLSRGLVWAIATDKGLIAGISSSDQRQSLSQDPG